MCVLERGRDDVSAIALAAAEALCVAGLLETPASRRRDDLYFCSQSEFQRHAYTAHSYALNSQYYAAQLLNQMGR
jgi:hypothetical protein